MFPYQKHSGLALAVVALLTTNWLDSTDAAEPEILLKTYTYKPVGDLHIKADIYLPEGDTKRPVVVWIQGGALINSHRAGVSGRVKDWALDSGYVLVSIDDRLAPGTQLPEIIQDLEDAFAWIIRSTFS